MHTVSSPSMATTEGMDWKWEHGKMEEVWKPQSLPLNPHQILTWEKNKPVLGQVTDSWGLVITIAEHSLSWPTQTFPSFHNVQLRSVSQSCLLTTPSTAAHQVSLFITNSRSLLKLMSIELVMPSSHLLSPSPPTFKLSQHQGLFQWVSSSHQVAKVLEVQLQHQSFWWIFRTDFLQEGLVGSPCSPRDSQESSPTPQLQKHQFFDIQLSLYNPTLMTTGKTIALTRRTCVNKVMSLLFKVSHCFHCFPLYLHEVMGPDAMILVF